MPTDEDDDVFKTGEEECPGPADLESALLLETLNNVTTQPPLMVEPAEIHSVTDAALDLGFSEPRHERLVGRRAAQECSKRLVASGPAKARSG